MEPAIRRLPKRRALRYADVIKPAFRLERDGRLEIYYAPVDWLRPTARLTVVGITPDKDEMLRAFQTVVDGLAVGRRPATVAADVQGAAPFSGFRPLLVEWLDYLGVGRHLGLASADELWAGAGRTYFHPTGAVRYPVFVGDQNHSGTNPRLTRHPLLLHYVDTVLGPELARIPDALVVPLGLRVDDAIARLVQAGKLDGARCLVGFPHPSGSNGVRYRQWAQNRAGLKRMVSAWFRRHPVFD